MSRDPQFLLMIQIALIGIVVVVGFFYIWKTLSRLEARIDELSSRDCHDINQSCSMLSNTLTKSQDAQMMSGEKNSNKNTYTEHDDEAYIVNEDAEKDEYEDDEDDDEDDDDEDDIALMRACFNSIPLQQLMDDSISPFTIFKKDNTDTNTNDNDNDSDLDNDSNNKFTKKSGITLSEAKESHDTIHKESIKADSHIDEDNISFIDTDTNEYSKTKLKKMNLDVLRDICSSRGLQTDGSKATLIDRVLSSFPASV